jgi:cytochrome P450
MRLNPFDDAYNSDPATAWRNILASGETVGYDDELGLWLIAGHRNARTVLSDSRRFSNALSLAPITPLVPAAAEVMAGIPATPDIGSSDGPQHTRLRSVLKSVFPTTADDVRNRWSALITRRATRLADEVADHPTADLMREYAQRLPLLVILDVLGIPAADAQHIARWSDDAVTVIWGRPRGEQQLAAAYGYSAFRRYCRNLVIDRIAAPGPGGLVDDLIAYRDGDDARLSAEQIAALTVDLATAGWETTTGALGRALELALATPQQWRQLAVDDNYLSAFVEESLRHSPAVDGWLRVTTTEVTLDEVIIPADSRCLVLLGTAGHDPNVFADPEVFDPTRPGLSQHVAFGHGPHYCLGAALARTELSIGLRVLAERLPQLSLAPDHQPQFKPSVAMRIHTALPALTITHTAAGCPFAHHASTEATR